jgi:hypothetical protein
MTEHEARTEAAKRERHKSKHMTHKRWSAVHDDVKGWHVVLVDVAPVIAPATLVERGLTLPAVAVCVALFGPTATTQALAALAKRDERNFAKGDTIKPNSTTFDIPRTEYFIPEQRKNHHEH